MASLQVDDFRTIYDNFRASVSRFDCGRFCAPLNDGEPVCCSTKHAIPVVDRAEFDLLKSRTDLWSRFKPYDAVSRQIVDGLHRDCRAIECKGARSCERDNRTLACRAFPFYPYITRQGAFVGLATYWIFEDRCWLMSNVQVIERDFVQEFVAAYESVMARDAGERQAMVAQSASHRRVFTRWDRVIPLIGRDGGFFKVMPRGGEIHPAQVSEFTKIGPYRSATAYRRAVKAAGGALPDQAVMVG